MINNDFNCRRINLVICIYRDFKESYPRNFEIQNIVIIFPLYNLRLPYIILIPKKYGAQLQLLVKIWVSRLLSVTHIM